MLTVILLLGIQALRETDNWKSFKRKYRVLFVIYHQKQKSRSFSLKFYFLSTRIKYNIYRKQVKLENTKGVQPYHTLWKSTNRMIYKTPMLQLEKSFNQLIQTLLWEFKFHVFPQQARIICFVCQYIII